MKQFNITCPMCQWQFDLMSGFQASESRDYWQMIMQAKLASDQIALLMRYLVFFKPKQYATSFTTLNARTKALLGLIKSGRVERGGNTRVATPADWYAAIEQLVTAKPENLQLPLKNHNYLIGMVFNACEAAVAKAEAIAIEKKRNRIGDDETAADFIGQMKSSFNPQSTDK